MKMPVAYLDVAARYVELAPHLIFRTPTVANLGSPVGLYLEQPWVGLTDEDVYPLANEHLHYQPESYEVSGIYSLARAIEAKLREKNA
jgi:hypothetical protein